MKQIRNLLLVTLVISSVLVITKCKNETVVPVNPLIQLKVSTTLGSYLTDKDGNALYFFSNDADGANNCTGGCTTAWPIFYISGLTQSKLANGLLLADFSSISTPNGTQLTYKGWPLYYYAPNGVRETPGQTTGEGVFGVWFVAKPDYTIMLANAQLVGLDGKNYVVSDANVYSEGTGSTKYFTDLAGRTLYAFSKDSANVNKFTKADFSNNANWPIYETDKVVVPSIFDKALFGSIDVFGKKQLTYKGWPMYYFGADADSAGKFRGNSKGVSVPTPGFWPVFTSTLPSAPTK
jgi:predicted lipoprotein with Yx(FWY)xxD motif